MARRIAPPADLRRHILDASAALLVEGGVGALSMREVARRAGVSHQAPYHHFPDRESILAAIAEEGFVELRARMAAAGDASKPAADRLALCGTAYVAFALARPGHFRVMFRPELVALELFPETARAADAAFELLEQVVAAAVREGLVAPADAEAATSYAWSLGHGLASLLLDGPLAQKVPGAARREAHVADVMALSARLLRASGTARARKR